MEGSHSVYWAVSESLEEIYFPGKLLQGQLHVVLQFNQVLWRGQLVEGSQLSSGTSGFSIREILRYSTLKSRCSRVFPPLHCKCVYVSIYIYMCVCGVCETVRLTAPVTHLISGFYRDMGISSC